MAKKVKKYRINKDKCTGCGVCVAMCPKAFRLGPDNKSEIISQEEAAKCKAEEICPFGAIEIDE